jgi:hypothetical protein
MNLPKRWDLEEHSCVNEEVVTFKRKLSKYLMLFKHVHYMEVMYDRKFHTRQGLHLNAKGKEHAARQLVDYMKTQAIRREQTVIPLVW